MQVNSVKTPIPNRRLQFAGANNVLMIPSGYEPVKTTQTYTPVWRVATVFTSGRSARYVIVDQRGKRADWCSTDVREFAQRRADALNRKGNNQFPAHIRAH